MKSALSGLDLAPDLWRVAALPDIRFRTLAASL